MGFRALRADLGFLLEFKNGNMPVYHPQFKDIIITSTYLHVTARIIFEIFTQKGPVTKLLRSLIYLTFLSL